MSDRDRLVALALHDDDAGRELLATLALDVSLHLPFPVEADWWLGCDEDWTLPVYLQRIGDEDGDTGAVCDMASADYWSQVDFLVDQLMPRRGPDGEQY